MVKCKLKALLADRELTQQELAERIGVQPSTLSAIANGKSPTVRLYIVDAICTELNCTVGDLFKFVPNE